MINQDFHPLVSICVPFFGVEKWISRSARSLFEQTYDNLEYIFVNDQTPDNSQQVLEQTLNEYPDRASNTRILIHKKNRGSSGARVTALDNVNGDFFIFADADDWLSPDFVKKMVEKQALTNADIVISAYQNIGNVENLDSPIIHRGIGLNTKDFFLKEVLAWEKPHFIWGILFRSSLQRKNQIYPQEGVNCGEDYQILAPLIYLANTITDENEAIYYYNVGNSTSMTTLSSDKNILQHWKSIDIVESLFKNTNQVYKAAILRFRVHSTLLMLDSIINMQDTSSKMDILRTYARIDNRHKTGEDALLSSAVNTCNLTYIRIVLQIRRFKRKIFFHLNKLNRT